MVIRDPFNIHKKGSAVSILRTTATRAAIGITEKAVEAGITVLEQGRKTAEEMSFQMPKNVPSFSNPQRSLEDQHWGTGTSSVSSRFGAKAQSLPMYKDKPYSYPPSQRSRAIWRRKRVAGVALLVLTLLYWFGAFSSNHDTETQKPAWGWLKGSEKENEKKVDWSTRRERVVEAFELSWDAYHRYAWGKSACCICDAFESVAFFVLTFRASFQATTSFTRSRRRADRWPRTGWAGSLSTPSTP